MDRVQAKDRENPERFVLSEKAAQDQREAKHMDSTGEEQENG